MKIRRVGEGEEVQEDQRLTLIAWTCSSKTKASVLYMRRPESKKTASYMQRRVSCLDSIDGEVEGVEAERAVVIDLL